ncbi:Uncharacterized protein Fot_32645 [Forsythia ovata]|uniref:Uncharacterized protein n=1 Tax=Forsythia ovata TaxID=205694 RepID=A0ABD1T8Y0_9LAMI
MFSLPSFILSSPTHWQFDYCWLRRICIRDIQKHQYLFGFPDFQLSFIPTLCSSRIDFLHLNTFFTDGNYSSCNTEIGSRSLETEDQSLTYYPLPPMNCSTTEAAMDPMASVVDKISGSRFLNSLNEKFTWVGGDWRRRLWPSGTLAIGDFGGGYFGGEESEAEAEPEVGERQRKAFFAQEMAQSIQDCGSQTVTKTSQSRPNEPQLSEMRFMPIPGIIEHGPDTVAHGPDVAMHGLDLQPNFSFENMVDDLQLMVHEEQSRMKAQRAKNIRNLRDSVRFQPQQNRNPD